MDKSDDLAKYITTRMKNDLSLKELKLTYCRTQRVQKPKEVNSKCKHDLHLMSTELLDLRILRLKDGIELIFKESVQHFNCGE